MFIPEGEVFIHKNGITIAGIEHPRKVGVTKAAIPIQEFYLKSNETEFVCPQDGFYGQFVYFNNYKGVVVMLPFPVYIPKGAIRYSNRVLTIGDISVHVVLRSVSAVDNINSLDWEFKEDLDDL